jgi:hypothetical protein
MSDAYERLCDHIRTEHWEFIRIMEQLIGSSEERRDVFSGTLRRMDAHGSAEERHLFPFIMGRGETRELGLELREWHRVIRVETKMIKDLDPEDELFEPRMRMARNILRIHFDLEEREALPLLKDLDDQEVESIRAGFMQDEGLPR